MSSSSPAADSLNSDLAGQPGAPWEREGAHPPPDADEAQLRAAKWQQAVDKAERRRERRKRKQALKEEAEKKAAERLENNARRMYYAGFFLLPFVWLVALIYYRNEHHDPNANPKIKQYYRKCLFFFVLYTIIFVTWFIIFEVLADGKLKSINILHFSGTSPNGF